MLKFSAATISVMVVLATAASTNSQVIQNGSFENNYTGWTPTGHQSIVANDANRPASDGAKVVVFNPSDQSTGAVLSQTFATTVGQRYELAFDYGVVGPISDQRLEVRLDGNGVLFDQVILIAGPDHGPFYVPQHIYFTANSANTKLTFTDASYTYVVIDSFLDDVRVIPVNAQAPSFTTQPQRQAAVQGSNAVFNVVASGPGTLSYQWQFDGANIPGANSSSYTVTAVDSSKAGNYSVVVSNSSGSITSSAATLTVLPPAILLNGSFEFGSAAWTFNGVATSTSTNPGYSMTDGAVLSHFNWGQQPPGGSISQTFSTMTGQTYTILFDLGAFSLVNQDEQRARVTLAGANNTILASKDFSVFAPGNGGRYVPETMSFTANSPSTRLTFLDISSATFDVDLLLDNVRVTVQNAPVISSQPHDATAVVGEAITFSVTAGGQAPLHYQWRFNNGSNWVNVGTDSSSFTINPVQAANAGMYDVIVSNGLGSVTSSSAVLTVVTPGTFTNGSFESDYAGWIATGNQAVVSGSPFSASDGVKAVAFNVGNNTPNGTLTQNFTTEIGKTYVLTFDLGAFSVVNQNEMRAQVTVQGHGQTSPSISQSISVFAPGNGTRYVSQSFIFVANATTTTLTFQDTTVDTSNADLMLDNVRVSAQAATAGFTNGSFESNYTGWSAAGNQGIATGSPYVATDGSRLVVFNGGQQIPNGTLSQRFATTAGQTYTVSFDVGAFSAVNQNEQRLQVSVQGNSTLVPAQVLSVFAPGNGNRYVSRSFAFTADATSATLTFQDVSPSTTNVDLLLDNVRVTAQQGPAIISQPQNTTAQAGGSASFSVTATGKGVVSYQWRFNNGGSWTDIAGANASTFTINSVQNTNQGNYDVVVSDQSGQPAVISAPATLTVVAAGVPANGSFEFDYAAWTPSGNQFVVSGSPFAASDGAKAVAFNAGDRTPNGVLSQTISTTAGQSYVLACDIGAFSLVNRNEQRLQVTVQGTNGAVLVSKLVSVFAPGNGTVYSSQTFSFTANGGSATLVFQDVSQTTSSVDLMLDHVRVTPLTVAAFTNGSFESDYAGWIASGNQNIQSSSPYVASNGVKVLTFNGGQTVPNGVLSQRFATTAGRTYSVTFDVGAFSLVNRDQQRLQVSVQGNNTLLAPQIVTVSAPGNGTSYLTQTFVFTADSASANLIFQDVSQTTTDVDLVLDNIRVQ